MQTTPASTPPFNLLLLLQDLERSIRLQLVDRLRAAGVVKTFDDMRQLPGLIGQIEAN